MSRLSYMMKRAMKMDYKAMLKTANMLYKKTGKSRIWLLTDMVKCAAKYNAGYVDYKIAQMYRLNDAQRATQITRGVSNSIVSRMNDKKFWHFFDNKTEFNELFAAQVRRGWLNLTTATKEEFAAFLKDRGDIICKPIDGSSGQGIFKCTPDEYADADALYECLKAAGIGIVEDKVIQHEAISALCPTSVNTIRVATLLGDKKEGIVYAYIRIGDGKVMDNVDCGGMAAPVDIETGVIAGVGANKAGETYEIHPMTGKRIPGTQILSHYDRWEGIGADAVQLQQKAATDPFSLQTQLQASIGGTPVGSEILNLLFWDPLADNTADAEAFLRGHQLDPEDGWIMLEVSLDTGKRKKNIRSLSMFTIWLCMTTMADISVHLKSCRSVMRLRLTSVKQNND